ncbi:MAG: T9SS type A sorting domain-containing protein [Paludibacteraceae bacterium]|nr:T9SS type A sorting domain-containing protein [Paludibacteraceae bacterium]
MNYASKRWLLVQFVVGITQCGFAQESVKSLIVSLNNPVDEKREMVFALSGTPKYWTQGEHLIIESTSLKGEFALSNVERITFAQAVPTSDIAQTMNDAVALYPNPTTEFITVKGVSNFQSVSLTDLNGRSLSVSQEERSDEVSFNVSALPAATYLLIVDGQTFKFVKR